MLVDSEGRAVLGESGPIRIAGESWSVGDDGSVTVDGAVVDRLLVADFDPAVATRRGEGTFEVPPAAVRLVPDPEVRQGQLESSNVQVIEEMVQMISSLRLFEASQKLLQAQDQMLDKAVNDVGRI
jgi:flagellar basal-body rod protein FlgG